MGKTPKNLFDLLLEAGQPISEELTELLAAYGPPPETPAFRGDVSEYAAAVRWYERLSTTDEAKARREALERYFARQRDRERPDA